MVRTREHTARKDHSSPCCCCRLPIRAGDDYRERVVINEEWIDTDYERRTAHTHCVSTDEGWNLTDPCRRDGCGGLDDRSLSYVRRAYLLDVHAGDGVEVPGSDGKSRRGTAIKGSSYVYVRFDDDRPGRSHPYHPNDVTVVQRRRNPAPLPSTDDDLPF